ncbi:phasin family protein [Sphingobium aromaticiconvertens]|uniref:phasin family protein n=1 Tax=Sphingobium aromaticiconvertens TaxID=365341 RepID=UPI0030174B2A
MAVTPKPSSRRSPARKSVRPKAAPGILSASEALKAAESAIEPTKPKAPASKAAPKVAKKAAPVKVAAPKPVAAKVAIPDPVAPDPVAIVAATTAVDAAPEPVVEKVVEATAKPAAKTVTPVTSAKVKIEPVKAASTATAQPTKVKPAPTAQDVRAEGTKMMNDVIETGKKFAEDAKAKMETAYADLNEKAKAGVEKSTKALEEISDITKGNVEALVESGKIAAKAMETLGQDAVDYSRKNYEKATATIKSFSTVKTPTEFFQLQSQLFASAFDDFSKQSAKGSEAFIKLANEVSQPLTARVTVVTDKIKSLAA